MIQKFKKKPVVIEAIQLTHENKEELYKWLGVNYISHSDDAEDDSWLNMDIRELSGVITVEHNDYVIKGSAEGDFYPCKPEIFESGFELVE